MDVMDSRVLTILFYSEMFKNVFALSANLVTHNTVGLLVGAVNVCIMSRQVRKSLELIKEEPFSNNNRRWARYMQLIKHGKL